LYYEPEEEYKQREVCSPDFFKNLNAKYQAEKKERDGELRELKNFIVKIRSFRFECSKSYMETEKTSFICVFFWQEGIFILKNSTFSNNYGFCDR
jgi:hypothetical protein